MTTRATKRNAADARRRERAHRSAEQQLDIIKYRKGESKRETARLLAEVANPPTFTNTEEVKTKTRSIKKHIRNLAKIRANRKRGY